jgi:hypothetical protein
MPQLEKNVERTEKPASLSVEEQDIFYIRLTLSRAES